MKILIYNWIAFDEEENKGGGVTVYTRNLLHALLQDGKDELYFLSSGRAYDAFSKKVRIEKTNNIFGNKVHSYQVVNSPVLSSAKLSFAYPEETFYDETLKEIIKAFLYEIGEVDVIHFQNLEGLSLPVLELKKEFPRTRFIYSLHNYYALCPQVMLWKNESCVCREKNTGSICAQCLPKNVFKDKVIYNQQINYDKGNGKEISKERLLRQIELENEYKKRTIDVCRVQEIAELMAEYRCRMVEAINRYVDVILAVSDRVKQIVVQKGMLESKIIVNYIGTVVANNQKNYPLYIHAGGRFKICFLGYPRIHKGFFFFLEALESFDEKYLHKLSLVIAAPINSDDVLERINNLRKRGLDIIFYPGYSHDDLESILSGVNLGIVPPIWEDNLPQVAIEMKAKGIPVLCSDLGGTKELSTAEGFCFSAGNISDFKNKLVDIIDKKVDIRDYFKLGMKLVSMEEHIKELHSLYEE